MRTESVLAPASGLKIGMLLQKSEQTNKANVFLVYGNGVNL
jgi:hypothetical protein